MSPKILYIAPLKDFSGYANAARDYVRALDSVGCNIVTRHIKYDSGDYKNSNREQELAEKDVRDVDIVIQHTTPNETHRKDGVFNVIYFAWETDRIPTEWVNKINEMDLALVPCDENILAARRCGVIIPIHKVVHTFDVNKYNANIEPFTIVGAENSFKFLSICQYSKKKGVDALLKAYLSEFKEDENVLLLLKTYVNQNSSDQDKNYIAQLVQSMKQLLRLKSYPKVMLLTDIMSDYDIARLYKTSNCYVLPSRGEGWGIPCFDALGYGLPSISTGWAGPTEFITKDCGWLVNYMMSPVLDMPHPHDFMYTAKDNWAEPNVCELKAAMREAYSIRGLVKWDAMRNSAMQRVKDFSYDIVGNRMKEIIYNYYNIWKGNNANKLISTM